MWWLGVALAALPANQRFDTLYGADLTWDHGRATTAYVPARHVEGLHWMAWDDPGFTLAFDETGLIRGIWLGDQHHPWDNL